MTLRPMTPDRSARSPGTGGVRFAVQRRRPPARIWVSLFDGGDRETERLEMLPAGDGVHSLVVPGLAAGARYGLRADGPYDPDKGRLVRSGQAAGRSLCRRDRPALCLRPAAGGAARRRRRHRAADAQGDRQRSCRRRCRRRPPLCSAGGLIYEPNVRAFTMRHPDVPERLRGTIAALAHPAIVDASQEARRRGGRTDADRRLDRRAPSAAARADAMPGATTRSPSWRSIRASRRAASPSCATPWPRCARPASASSSTSSSTTPARATRTARRCRCAASTTAATTAHEPQRSGPAGQRHRHRQHHRLRQPAGGRADPRCAAPFRALRRRRRLPLRPRPGPRPRPAAAFDPKRRCCRRSPPIRCSPTAC